MTYLFIIFLVTSFSFVGAMDRGTSSLQEIRKDRQQYITSPAVASEMCSTLVTTLYNQPLFDGKGSCAKKCKVLPLGSIDSRVIDILYENTAKKLGKHCTVHSFGGGTHLLYDCNKICLGDGITQWLYDDKSFKDNDADIEAALASGLFKNTCDEVVKDLLTGWKKSTLVENPGIFYKNSEEEWYLFVKSAKLIKEDHLMRIFFSVVDVRYVAKCNCDWLNNNNRLEFRDMLYLWIKKQSFDEVVNKLGLRIE